MKELLNRLFEHQSLSRAEANLALKAIAEGRLNAAQMSAFLTVFIMRSITVEELSGFRDALLELCIPIDLEEFDAIDLCGTGGDGKDTFNISTLSSFVVAGTGEKVAKHGNYGVSSACGSSNVLEFLGYPFTNDQDILKKQIDYAGICFLHAPLFHPAMKEIAPIRRQMGVKTFFNMLGPMVNPSFPKQQLVGVFSLELARLYQYLFQQTDKKYAIIHSLDGYDEVSLTGSFKWISHEGERMMNPLDLNLPQLKQEQLFGGSTVAEAAGLFNKILDGKGTEAQNSAVIANSGLALFCKNHASTLEQCLEAARTSLLGGKAKEALKKLLEPQSKISLA